MSFKDMIAAIAKECNGTIMEEEFRSDNYARILFANNVGIGFRRRNWGANPDKITAYAFMHGVNLNDINSIQRETMPEISFDCNKAIHKIINDVNNRLINPAKPLIEKMKNRIKEYNYNKNYLEEMAASFKKSYPTIRAHADGSCVNISNYEGISFDCYFQSGTITFNRIYSIPLNKAERILKILTEK